MKKSILLIGSFCVVALGVLGYTFLYAGTGNEVEKDCSAATCEKAHAGVMHDAAAGECPYAAAAAKKAGEEGCCAAKGAAESGSHDKGSCPTFAKMCDGKSKEDCAKFHAGPETKPEKIEIK